MGQKRQVLRFALHWVDAYQSTMGRRHKIKPVGKRRLARANATMIGIVLLFTLAFIVLVRLIPAPLPGEIQTASHKQ